MRHKTMKNKTLRLLRNCMVVLLIGFLGVLFGPHSVHALYTFYDESRSSYLQEQCYVSPSQTVIEWKSMDQTHCRISVKGICVWPIPHKHMTYKVTVNDGIPLRTTQGKIIAATNGEERNWLTYDSNSWNSLENNLFRKNLYSDFQPIASNEYVVMVETRYRLFNNVDSTLGICTQQ